MAIPRWTLAPVPGIAGQEAPVASWLAAALRSVARDLDVPVGSVLLTAHARVLGALTGEREVWTGYAVAPARAPLPLRLSIERRTCRGAIRAVRRDELEALRHADLALEALEHEMHARRPAYETIFDPAAGIGPALDDHCVLGISLRNQDGLTLKMRYRTDVLDAEAAARILGYHLAALEQIVADPDADSDWRSVVSEEERRFQIEGLSGPHRTLPDHRAHELIEARAHASPDAVAAIQGDRRWTYRELNTRANRLARALMARGLGLEAPAAVVTGRNLDWMAAVLAILKAGGAYLPIEPDLPSDRIAKMLARAGCRVVLTERGSTAMLDRAVGSLPDVEPVFLDEAGAEGSADGDLGIDIPPGRLAYIYFTSGSTGEPKGVMCQHDGLLNHLLAKIHDLEIGPETVVAQTAPRCFDISLWQLLGALLVGGRTLLIEQEAILDAARFIDTVIRGRVAVLQVVPSYLEVLVSYLEERPRTLPDLRCVSVTGEALKRELVRRWFAAQPGVTLVNAYGLTETSDDTNHEILSAVPDGERVPVGRPVQNVHVTIVDERLSLVPLGAPGEIAFSGVCVGRGYVNDEERTREAFVADPYRPGLRLYRSGDRGRWLPDGRLEFLGRRDTQVKINGFRIELGEIENTLLRVTGIRDAAVVVAERANGNKHLVAFYAAGRSLEADNLRSQLAASLPDYMVPSAFHRQQSLPLTASGKIDTRALTVLAGSLEAPERLDGPTRTETERRLRRVWAEVLGLPEGSIGRNDHFFDLGGTSLSAVLLMIRLGRAVSLEDLAGHARLADLAALIDARSRSRDRRSA